LMSGVISRWDRQQAVGEGGTPSP